MADTISTLAAKLRPHWLRDVANVTTTVSGGAVGVTDHGALSGLFDDDHPQYLTPVRADVRYLTASRQIIAGNGLTGGGDLSADVTLAVGAGAGITVNADDVALTTPGTLAITSTNYALGNHTHQIDASADVGTSPAAALLKSTTGGGLTLGSVTTNQAASLATFASGFAGSGWRADYGVTTASRASIETDDLTVRGRMRVYELLIQQIRATNGSLLVTSSSKVVTVSASANPAWTVNGSQLTFNGSNATLTFTLYTITTSTSGEDAAAKRTYHGFLTGDIIRAQQVEWNGSAFGGVIQSNLEVTSVTNLYTYKAAYVSGDAPAIGYDFVRLGNSSDSTRRGVVYLTSDDSAAPFIDIVDNISYHSDWNSAGAIKARLGKLTGISDTAFGGALSGYGLYSNNVYLKGKIVVTGGSLGGLAAADVNSNTTTIDGGHITTGTVTASQIAANTITANEIAANTITGSKMSLTTTIGINSLTFGNSGIQLDYNAGSPRFYAGNGASNFIQYNGTNVSMTGFITATGGSFTGAVYCGSNAVRFSTDGQRLVLPNLGAPNLKTTIPSNSSAMRWFAGIDDTWTNAANYTGMIGYRDTTNKVVDFVQMSYVGSTDYSTYYARSMLYANRYNGSTDKECRLEATVDPGTGGAYVTATCDTFYTSVDAYIGDDIYIVDNCSALTFTDRTPYFDGDALAQLRPVRGKTRTVKGKAITEIDHSSIPAFARKQVRDLKTGEQRDERDLGAMISLLTAAVQQLDARLDALEGRGNGNR